MLVPPPPRVSSQRTGTVFNLEVSPSFIQKMVGFYPDHTPKSAIHEVKQKISSWLDEALSDHNVFPNSPNESLKEGETAVKIFYHPSDSRRVVVLTHQDALDFPSGNRPQKVAYLQQASERGTTVPIACENSLGNYVNQLYTDLGISQNIYNNLYTSMQAFFWRINN